MTAVSFKSLSGDDYLEISEGEAMKDFVKRMVEEHGYEWPYMEVVLIKSTDHRVSTIQRLIDKSRENMEKN